jgi:hypothetical protein
MSPYNSPGGCNDQRTGPSISRRLARTLALLMLGGLGLASALIFSATAMRMREVQADTLEDKTRMLTGLVAAASNPAPAPASRLHALTAACFTPMRMSASSSTPRARILV